MSSLSRRFTLAAVVASSLAVAGPKGGQGRFDDFDDDGRHEAAGDKVRMLAVVGIAEALSLSEADALKLSERLKGFEAKRKPVREGMKAAMHALKAAAEGDAASQAQVDANVQRLLDGRAQLAQLDKELFTTLAQGQSPEKRAKLALFLARFNHQLQRFKGRRGH